MTKFMDSLKLMLQLLPAIIMAVKALEEAIPIAGKGAEKLEVLREIIGAAYENLQGAAVTFDELWPSVQRTVSAVVALFNRTGAWDK
jgi:hypothetical protein